MGVLQARARRSNAPRRVVTDLGGFRQEPGVLAAANRGSPGLPGFQELLPTFLSLPVQSRDEFQRLGSEDFVLPSNGVSRQGYPVDREVVSKAVH